MNFKYLYSFLAFLMVLNSSGIIAMQETPSAQLWYQAKLHNKIQKLNHSFAQLIGASQDFESHATVKHYAEQTKKNLDAVHDMVKQFNWCPGLIDQAVVQIQDKLLVSDDIAWTGSYAKTELGQQFTLAQDMKNWLLLACTQADNKKESAEYAKLELMSLKKDFLDKNHSLKKEQHQFKHSFEYPFLQYQIAHKTNTKELSWWNDLCLEANLIGAEFNEVMLGEQTFTQEQEEHYKQNCLDQEIKTLEDTVTQHDTLRNELSNKYSENFNTIKTQKTISLQGACLQLNNDTLVFKDKQGNLNSFYDVIWKLFKAKSRKDLLKLQTFVDGYNPVKYYSTIKSNQWYNFFGAEKIQEINERSTGQRVVFIAGIIDQILFYRDRAGQMPSEIAAKCLSMLLASPSLCNAVVGLGLNKKVIDVLFTIKKNCNENGFSVNDVLTLSNVIGDDGLGLVLKLCIQAMGEKPEKWAHTIDSAFDSMRGWIDNASEPDFSSAKTASDDYELLAYVAMANKNTYVSPIRVIEQSKQPEVSFSESLYNNVCNKKTLAVLGFAGIVYGSYRYKAPQVIMRKVQELPVKESLSTLGAWAYNYFKK